MGQNRRWNSGRGEIKPQNCNSTKGGEKKVVWFRFTNPKVYLANPSSLCDASLNVIN